MTLASYALTLSLALSSGGLPADEPRLEAALSQYELTHWDINDGLNQNTVRAIAQLPDGHLVVGTYEGLMLFDGSSFHPLPDNTIDSLERNTTLIASDTDGTLWVGGTDSGLHHLVPLDSPQRSAIREHYHASKVDANGLLPGNHVTALSTSRKNVWVGTPEGLLRFDGRSWSRQSPTGRSRFPISALWSDNDLTVVANNDGEAWIVRDEVWTALDWNPGLEDPSIWIITGDESRLYLGTGSGVAVLDRDGAFVSMLGAAQGVGPERVSALRSHAGALWIGTYGGGLYRWNEAGELAHLTIKSGLKSDYIQSLFVDRSGVLWVGTSAGLDRLYRADFTTIGMPQGLSSRPVRAVLEDDYNALWVGVDASQGAAGLHRIDADGSVTRFGADEGLEGDAVRAITLGPAPNMARTLWVASYGEALSYLDSEGRLQQPDWVAALPSLRIRALHFDRQGRFWIISDDRGIWVRTPEGTVLDMQKAIGLNSNRFNHIIETDKAFWFGSFGDGVARWQPDQGVMQWRASDEGLPSASLMTLFEDRDGMLWAGTDSGLAFFDGKHWRQPFSADTPWDKAIMSLLHDRYGALWICLNRGIVRVDKQALLDAQSHAPTYRLYSHHDGLLSAQCNGGSQPASFSRDGQHLWFATADGLAGTSATPDITFPPVPAPVIESVLAGGQELLSSPDARLTLQPDAQRVVLRFSSPTSVTPQAIEYRYRIPAFDRDWLIAGPDLSAQYTGLPVGQHRFEVQAKRAGQNWSQAQGTTLEFYRQPHWSETTTFQLLAIAFGGMLLLAVYRLRLRSLKARAETLQRHVDERTQTLRETIAELTDTRSRLVDAQRMASMARMLAGISHELNTPLGNGLVVSSRLGQVCEDLRKQLNSSQPSRTGMNKALDDMHSGLGLIHTSLDKAAILLKRLREANTAAREQERETFSLAELLNELPLVVSDRERSKNCQLSVQCPADLCITSYPRILRDVILELVDNSAEHGFAKQAGAIQIEVMGLADGGIEITYCDNGRGIDEGRREIIFEPMSASLADSEHSGLGMHRVYNQITAILQGRIELCPASEGVCFSIRLPSLPPRP